MPSRAARSRAWWTPGPSSLSGASSSCMAMTSAHRLAMSSIESRPPRPTQRCTLYVITRTGGTPRNRSTPLPERALQLEHACGMRDLLRQLGRVFGDAATRWDEVEGFRLGAAFSFYATFSIFPLLLLTVTVLGFVIGDADPARAGLLDVVGAPGSPVRQVIESTITSMQQAHSARGLSALVGL